MRRSSRLKLGTSAAALSAFVVALACGSDSDRAWAQSTIHIGSGPAGTPGFAAKLNPTGRPIVLTIPLVDGTVYLGDIILTIEPDDEIQFAPDRALGLLSESLNKTALDNLRARFAGKSVVTPADFSGSGVDVHYDQQSLQLVFDIPLELKSARNIAVAPLYGQPVGDFIKPANFSAYLNVRGSVDYVDRGANVGLQDPVFFLDGAAWSHGIALESEGVWQPGTSGAEFQRQGSRLIYDDTSNVIRWTAGDLQPVGQGFQSVNDMAGISLFRSYNVLDPLRSVRPSGDQSFRLTRPSNVTLTVNGTTVRRLRLDPGNYNLRDFPFSQGANDITVFIEDDTGRQETLRFNVFFDQTQLDAGLSEFGVFAGVEAPLGQSGPHYTNDLEVTGYYRRGVSQFLTLGANFQADQHTWLAGGQALWASPIGSFGFDGAVSHVRDFGSGYAATLTFQRLFQFVGGQGDSLNLAATTRSRDFAPVGVTTPDNRYVYELSGGYSHAFDENLYASLTAHYSHGRDGAQSVGDYHAILGYRLSPDLGLTFDGSYQDGVTDNGLGFLLTITWAASESSSVRGDYNTRNDDARLTYQNVSGTGVGSYNISADVERNDDGGALNATANYIANRAELGLSHFTTFSDGGLGTISDQRTSARIGTSIAYADGAVSVGRPVTQAFAVVEGHKSLGDSEIDVNPTPYGVTAQTDGLLPTALEGDLAAYVPRTITVNAPDAPPGYDLGTGSFRVQPPYRAGYRLQVGSDYSVTALGRLLTETGEPLQLIAGKAIEVDNPSREPVTLFTNAQGHFGIAGLKPGRWRIEMPTEPVTVYYLEVPANAVGAIKVGDLSPSQAGQ